jgi:glutaredoxin-related protein
MTRSCTLPNIKLLLLNVVVVLVTLTIASSSLFKVHAAERPQLFWGDGCPHCEIAKEEIIKQDIDPEGQIEYLEVYSSEANTVRFSERLRECGIHPDNAGVPMLYLDGQCYVGDYQVVGRLSQWAAKSNTLSDTSSSSSSSTESIANTSEQNTAIVQTESEDGKRNTEALIIVITIFLVVLVFGGYLIQKGKARTISNIAFVGTLLSLPLIITTPVQAVCPVCTVAVGAGLGFSRYLGIDDTITSLWIGGLIVSTIYWIIDWLSKRNITSRFSKLTTVLVTYILVLAPLYWGEIIGLKNNLLWGMDKVLLGTTVGSVVFWAGGNLHFYIKRRNRNKVVIPFQKVVVPVGSLLLATIVFYLIIY